MKRKVVGAGPGGGAVGWAAALKVSLQALGGLLLGLPVGLWLGWGGARPERAASAPQEDRPAEQRPTPPVSAAAQGEDACEERLRAVEARRQELEQRVQAEQGWLEDREGRTLPWPAEPSYREEAVRERWGRWSAQSGAELLELDCEEYPCLVALRTAPGQKRSELDEQLPELGWLLISVQMIQGGGAEMILCAGEGEAQADRRTQWRAEKLAERRRRGDP